MILSSYFSYFSTYDAYKSAYCHERYSILSMGCLTNCPTLLQKVLYLKISFRYILSQSECNLRAYSWLVYVQKTRISCDSTNPSSVTFPHSLLWTGNLLQNLSAHMLAVVCVHGKGERVGSLEGCFSRALLDGGSFYIWRR